MAIKVGIVGARGLSTLPGLQSISDVTVEALCDLDETLIQAESQRHGIPKTYRVFEDMLDSDIDAVIIATPMHLHVPQSLQALEAGKHVMSEVTAGVTMDELWWLKEAVEKYEKVYMLAENYCYIPENQLVKNMVEMGLFGDLYFGEGEYIHNIKSLAFVYNRDTNGTQADRRSWRYYWQLGKRGSFYPTHSLGPVMQWFKGDRVKYVSSFGSGWHTSSSFRQEDTSLTICQLESGKLVKLRVDCISERPHNMSYYSLQGTKGCYEAPRGLGDTHKVWLKDDNDSQPAHWKPLTDYLSYLPDRYMHATQEQKSSGHWGGRLFHRTRFHRCNPKWDEASDRCL